jgi:hypothetical protein
VTGWAGWGVLRRMGRRSGEPPCTVRSYPGAARRGPAAVAASLRSVRARRTVAAPRSAAARLALFPHVDAVAGLPGGGPRGGQGEQGFVEFTVGQPDGVASIGSAVHGEHEDGCVEPIVDGSGVSGCLGVHGADAGCRADPRRRPAAARRGSRTRHWLLNDRGLPYRRNHPRAAAGRNAVGPLRLRCHGR